MKTIQIQKKRRKMMNKKTILLVDGENILHQSFHKFEKLKSTDGKPSGAIFGFSNPYICILQGLNPMRFIYL